MDASTTREQATGTWLGRGVKLALLLLVGGTLYGLLPPKRFWKGPHSPYRAARAQMHVFAQAIDMHRVREGALPGSLQTLTLPSSRSPHAYLATVPCDPLGSAYDYVVLAAGGCRIRSPGEDGLADTEDDLVWPPLRRLAARPSPADERSHPPAESRSAAQRCGAPTPAMEAPPGIEPGCTDLQSVA